MLSHAVTNCIISLEHPDGSIYERAVVDHSRDPNSPLHAHIEQDREKGFDDHCLGQARQLIRQVRIEVHVRRVPVVIPRYVRPSTSSEIAYQNIKTIRAESDHARAVITEGTRRAIRDLKRVRQIARFVSEADVEILTEIIGRLEGIGHFRPEPEDGDPLPGFVE